MRFNHTYANAGMPVFPANREHLQLDGDLAVHGKHDGKKDAEVAHAGAQTKAFLVSCGDKYPVDCRMKNPVMHTD